MMLKFQDQQKFFLPSDEKVTFAVYRLGPSEAERQAIDRTRARMAWLDEQDADFRALVHDVGLNRACQQTGRRVPV